MRPQLASIMWVGLGAQTTGGDILLVDLNGSSPGLLVAGNTVIYEIMISNDGPMDATDVDVSDTT